MADNVLKAFLVSIGYKIDETGMAKATASVDKAEATATKSVAGGAAARDKVKKSENEKDEKRNFEADKKARDRRDKALKDFQVMAVKVAAIAAKITIGVESLSAGGILYAVDKAAKGFEQLFYASQRIGGTAQGITAVEYAIGQLGGSTESARQSMEAFGDKLRTQRESTLSYLQSIGVQIRDAKGNILDADHLYTNFLKTLATKPQIEAKTIAGVMGTDEITRLAGANPQFQAQIDARRAQQAAIGTDPNAAAAAGTAFEQTMRRLLSVVDDIGSVIEVALIKNLKPQLDKLADWATQNGGKIAEFVASLANGVTDLATAFVKSDVVQSAVGSIAAGLERFAKYVSSDDFKKDVKTFSDDIGAMARAVERALRYFGLIPSAGTDSGRTNQDEIDANNAGVFGSATRRHGSGIFGLTTQRHSDEDRKSRADGKLENFRSGGGVGRAQQNANSAAITDELRKAGLPDEGIAAALGSMQTESSLNPAVPENSYNHGHHGLIQWDSERWPKVKSWIESQGGDAMDARWQARAFVAEGRAKPGDPLYNGSRTAQGFSKLEQAKGNLDLANEGMRDIERFGPGEEGGRAASARAWLPKLQAPAPAPAPVTDQPAASAYTSRDGVMSDANLARYNADRAAWLAAHPSTAKLAGMSLPMQAGVVGDETPLHKAVKDFYAKGGGAMGAGAWKMAPDGFTPSRPLGDTPALHSSIDNSRRVGDITHNPTFNVSGGDVKQNMEAARLMASRGDSGSIEEHAGSGGLITDETWHLALYFRQYGSCIGQLCMHLNT